MTDSSGHQDETPPAEQLAERAVELVAAREGVSSSYLEVINSTRPRWLLINKSSFAFKVLDHANIRIYGITLDAGGQELDISRLDAEEEAARTSKYGKLSPFLFDRLETATEGGLVAVTIRLKTDSMPLPRPDTDASEQEK